MGSEDGDWWWELEESAMREVFQEDFILFFVSEWASMDGEVAQLHDCEDCILKLLSHLSALSGQLVTAINHSTEAENIVIINYFFIKQFSYNTLFKLLLTII